MTPANMDTCLLMIFASLGFVTASRFKPRDFGNQSALSIREWPDPHLLLADLPKTREPARFDDQEQDDQSAHSHEGQMLDRGRQYLPAECGPGAAHEDRQPVNQCRSEEGADKTSEPANNDHEQDEERLVDAEHGWLGAAVPEEDHQRAGDAAIVRRYGEG